MNNIQQSPGRWGDYTPDEQRLIISGLEGYTLVGTMLNWIPDPTLPNRNYLYVARLIPMARRLLRLGIIEVHHYDAETRQYKTLPVDEEILVISDIDNWWRFDPEEAANDPDGPQENPVIGGGPPTAKSTYSLYVPEGRAPEQAGGGIIAPWDVMEPIDPPVGPWPRLPRVMPESAPSEVASRPSC